MSNGETEKLSQNPALVVEPGGGASHADLARRIEDLAAKLDAHLTRFQHFFDNWTEIQRALRQQVFADAETLRHHEDEIWLIKDVVFPESQKLIKSLYRPVPDPDEEKDPGAPPLGKGGG